MNQEIAGKNRLVILPMDSRRLLKKRCFCTSTPTCYLVHALRNIRILYAIVIAQTTALLFIECVNYFYLIHFFAHLCFPKQISEIRSKLSHRWLHIKKFQF